MRFDGVSKIDSFLDLFRLVFKLAQRTMMVIRIPSPTIILHFDGTIFIKSTVLHFF